MENFNSKLKSLIEETEQIKIRIGKERDRLREIAGEIEEIAETCDRAEETLDDMLFSLRDSVDSLSELV